MIRGIPWSHPQRWQSQTAGWRRPRWCALPRHSQTVPCTFEAGPLAQTWRPQALRPSPVQPMQPTRESSAFALLKQVHPLRLWGRQRFPPPLLQSRFHSCATFAEVGDTDPAPLQVETVMRDSQEAPRISAYADCTTPVFYRNHHKSKLSAHSGISDIPISSMPFCILPSPSPSLPHLRVLCIEKYLQLLLGRLELLCVLAHPMLQFSHFAS